MLANLLRYLISNPKFRRLCYWALGLAVSFALLLYFTKPSGTLPSPVIQPAAQPAPAPTSTTPQKAQLILELFNPGDASLSKQLTTTVLEQQLEQALITSFVLRKCGILSHSDFSDSFRAMIYYAMRTHLAADATSAETTVRRISESAGTSYALLYSRTDCADATLPQLAYTLRSWTQLMLTQ